MKLSSVQLQVILKRLLPAAAVVFLFFILFVPGCSKPEAKLYGEWISVDNSQKLTFNTDGSWQMNAGDAVTEQGKYNVESNKVTLYNRQGKDFLKGKFSVEDASLLIADELSSSPVAFVKIAPDKYLRIFRFKEKMLKVEKDTKFGFINAKGVEVIPPKYDDASDFTGGLAIVREGNKLYCINTAGATELTLDTRHAEIIQYPETDGDSVIAMILKGSIVSTGKIVWNGKNNTTDKEIREYILHGDSLSSSVDSLLLATIRIDTTYQLQNFSRRMIVISSVINGSTGMVPFFSAYLIIPFKGMMILEAADHYITELGLIDRPAQVYALAPGNGKAGLYFVAGVSSPNYKKTDGYLYPFYDGEFTEALRVALFFDGGGDPADTTLQRYQSSWSFFPNGEEYNPLTVAAKGRAYNPDLKRVTAVLPETKYRFASGNYIKENK